MQASFPAPAEKFPAPTPQGIRQFDGKTLELRRELALAGAELTGDFEKFLPNSLPAGNSSFKPAPAADRVT